MRNMGTHRIRLSRLSVAGVMAISSIIASTEFAPSSFAATPSCSSHFCEGSDGATTSNQGSGTPLYYMGGIGIYYLDCKNHGVPCAGGTKPCPSDPSRKLGPVASNYGACYEATTLRSSRSLYANGSGSGIGYGVFYLGGGPWSQYKMKSLNHLGSTVTTTRGKDYCWGWVQGSWANSNMTSNSISTNGVGQSGNTFHSDLFTSGTSLMPNKTVVFLDVERKVSSHPTAQERRDGQYGWGELETESNKGQEVRDVFNGFSDYIAGRATNVPGGDTGTCPSSRSTAWGSSSVLQYGLYSSPIEFADTFSNPTTSNCPGTATGCLTHTVEWSSENSWAPLIPYPNGFSETISGRGTDTAAWFGYPSFSGTAPAALRFCWQYSETPLTPYDYDVCQEPQSMSFTGATLGN